MPTLTLLTNNTFINPSFFELVGIDQASITSASATEINMEGVFSGGTFRLIGTGMTVVNVNGRDFINGGIVQTIEFRVINNNFNITNLNMFGSVLGTAMLADFNGSDQGAVERLFLGLDYTINGTTGNDTHNPNSPNSLDGVPLTLTGNNSYELAAGNDVVSDAGSGGDTISGGTGNDELSGGFGNDSLLGGNDNDILRGQAGNDTLLAGTGQDTLYGGENDDLLRVDTGIVAGEVFDGGTDIDTLSFAGLDFGSQGGYVVNLAAQVGNFGDFFGAFLVTVTGIENLIGSEQGDGFFGDGLANRLDGRGGADTLQGAGGNDTLIGGEGVDDLDGGADDDLLFVGPRLAAGEVFDGGTGNDTLSFAGLDFGALGGYVVVLGDQTADFNTGGFLSFVTGIETVLGSVQGDSFSGDGLANLLDGREGNDTLVGLGGNDTLIGGAGIDRLFGGDDSDLLLTGSNGLTFGEIYDGDGGGFDTFSLEGLAFGGFRVNLVSQFASLLTGVSQVTLREVEIVIGGVDGDEITGSTGSDRLEGRQGNDTLIGDNGSDQLFGDTGADSMIGGQGNDLYLVDDAGDVVIETGNAIADGLTDEVISSVSYSISDAGAVFIERLRLTGTDNLDGTGNGLDNRITGNDGNNSLSGLNGNDSIFGGDGNDSLVGGSGNDAMFGNEGDDTYIVFDALDVASEAVNGITDEGGTDTVEAFVSYSLNGTDGRQFIENLTLTPGGNAVTGTGNALDNIITGNDGVNVLDGLGGNDTLFGGLGNDVLIGGDGFDRLFGGADNDSFGVITSEGSVVGSEDSLDGGTGIDSVEFVSGAGVNAGIDLVSNEYSLDGFGTFGAILGIERVTTGSGDDGVVGNLDTTFVDVGLGNDSVELATLTTEARGGEGDDTLTLLSLGSAVTINLSTLTLQTGFENLFLTSFDDNGTGTETANLLAGGSGNDTLFGLGGADRLFGGFDNDELNGGAGNDTLDGGAGFDRLFGGADDDDFGLIISQAGIVVLEDSIDGGTGIDRVAFDSGAGVDVIVDLQAGDYSFDGFGTAGAITGIERVTTGSGNDSVLGGGGTTFIDVGLGNDEVGLTTLTTEARGGEGTDRLDLRALAGPAIINLSTSTLQTGFENLNLTAFADNATGTNAANDLFGGFGNDTLNGLGGADLLNGGEGTADWAFYTGSATAVQVSLVAGAVNTGGDAAGDVLTGIERLFGSTFNDLLTGNAGINRLSGNSGDDTLQGGAGADSIYGGAGTGDTASYANSATAVQVSLVTGAVNTGGDAAGDTLADIERLLGSGLGDILTGNAGVNRLEGGSGDDTLQGGAGVDSLIGGAGTADWASYTGSATAVQVSLVAGAVNTGGDAAGDVLTGIERLFGSTFNDLLTGNAGINRLSGNSGDDTLQGGAGADSIYGGAGTGDTASYANSATAVQVSLVTGAVNTGGDAAGDTLADIERLLGSGLGDILTGNAGVNRLEGGSGDDTLQGGAGVDSLIGGAGTADWASYASSATAVQVSLVAGAVNTGGDAAGDVLTGIERLFGSQFADQLTGDAGINRLSGNSGDDTLQGGAGADSIFGGAGTADWASYASSATGVRVSLVAGAINTGGDAAGDVLADIERLFGSQFADQLTGNAGINRLSGNDGNDTIEGGAGGDALTGGAGTDTLSYASSMSAVNVNLNANSASGGDAQGDTISLFENLTGSGFNDTLSGNTGSNIMRGGNGNDAINAWHGSDFVFGGLGNDTLRGSLGADRFYFDTALNATTNVDTLSDFSIVDDFIMLENAVFTALTTGGALAAGRFAVVAAGGNATTAAQNIVYEQSTGRLFYDADGSSGGAKIHFASVTANTALTAGDFWVY